MKKITVVLLALLLAGCGFLAPTFDPNEYNQFVNMHSNMVFLKSECGTDYFTTALVAVKWDSAHLVTYTSHIVNNDEIAGMAKIIDGDVLELHARNATGMSQTYCELKADQLIIKLDRAMDAIGNLK